MTSSYICHVPVKAEISTTVQVTVVAVVILVAVQPLSFTGVLLYEHVSRVHVCSVFTILCRVVDCSNSVMDNIDILCFDCVTIFHYLSMAVTTAKLLVSQ